MSCKEKMFPTATLVREAYSVVAIGRTLYLPGTTMEHLPGNPTFNFKAFLINFNSTAPFRMHFWCPIWPGGHSVVILSDLFHVKWINHMSPTAISVGGLTRWWLQAVPPITQGPWWNIVPRARKLIFQAFSVSINFKSMAPFKNAFLVPDLARRPFGGDFQQLMVVGSFHVGKLDCRRRIAMLVGSLPCWKASLL